MRLRQSLLAVSECFFGRHLLRNVQSMAQHSRRRSWFVVTDVAVRPDSLRAVFRQQSHEAAVGPFGADPLQIFVKQRANLRDQKLFEVASHAFFRPITQRSTHRGIDRQQHAIHIVDAHEPQALLHEQPIEHQLLLNACHGWHRFHFGLAQVPRQSRLRPTKEVGWFPAGCRIQSRDMPLGLNRKTFDFCLLTFAF